MTDFWALVVVSIAGFCAGLVDAIVGGGGLIQAPVTFLMFPNHSIASLLGTLKIPAFSGTVLASRQFVAQIKIYWKWVLWCAPFAIASSFVGSWMLTKVDVAIVKPLLFAVLVFVAVFTFFKKDFGMVAAQKISEKQKYIFGALSSILVGFYDGFIGPGTGIFFVLAFISLLKFDFLGASAHGKIINLLTNIGSLLLFFLKGMIVWKIAIPMGFCNALGGYLGAKLALNKGNLFIKKIFMAVVALMLVRFGYDVFFG